MKNLLLAAMFSSILACAQPTCSSPTVIVGPTWARIEVQASGAWQYSRVQYGPTTSYGTIIGVDGTVAGGTFGVGTIGGLAPSTSYNAALQLSNNNSTWCTAANVAFTTLADSTWEPDAPVPVTHSPRTQPATTGTAVTATTCASIATAIAAATPANNTVLISSSLDCSSDDFPGNQLLLNTTDGARGWWRLTDINATTNTMVKPAHGLSDGTVVRIAPTNNYGRVPKGLDPTLDYFVVSATTNSFQVSLTLGGAAVDFKDGGAFGASEISYQSGALPVPIVIMSSRWAELPPLGVQVTDADAPLMPIIRMRVPNSSFPLFDFRGMPGPVFLRGIRFVPDAPATVNTPGGQAASRAIVTSFGQRNLTVAQVIAGMTATYPQRVSPTLFEPNGTDIAVVDSLIGPISYWRPWNKSVNPSVAGATLTLAAGTYYLGHRKCVTSAATATLSSGTAGGSGMAWLDGNCAITIQLPTGYAGSCTNCTITTTASPSYPVASGAYTVWPIADLVLGSVVFTAAAKQEMPVFQNFNESGNVISWAWARRIVIENNTIRDSPGIAILGNAEHYDNQLGYASTCDPADCAPLVAQGDALIRRNRITYSPSVLGLDDGSETLRQFVHRNAIEFKDCTRCRVEGNFVDGNFKSAQNAGPAILFTPVSVQDTVTTRVTCSSCAAVGNYVRSAAGVQVTGRYTNASRVGLPSDRILLEHNFFHIDSSLVAPHSVTNVNGGILFAGGPQRVTLRSNTWRGINNTLGTVLLLTCVPTTLRVENNVMQMNNSGGYGGMLGTQCTYPGTLSGLSTASGVFGTYIASGATWSGNVLVAGLAADGVTDLTSGEATTLAARHLAATWPAGATVAARLAAANMQPDWQRTIIQTAGADERLLAGIQGRILGDAQVSASSSTSLTAFWYAPDSVGCWVDRSINGGLSWLGLAQASGGARQQQLNITGLSPATVYLVRVRCGGDTKTAAAML